MTKNTLITLLAIVLLACTKEEEPYECNCNEPFFDPVYLDSIHLDQIDYFWNYDSVLIFNSDQDIQIYNTHITYLGGREYYQWAEKSCRITVFNNRDMAVDAMQVKINAVSAPYYI